MARIESDRDLAIVFGRRVRAARRANGWSQVELADLSGVGVSRIPLIESGRINARLDTVAALARALKIPPEKMVSRN